MVQSINGFQGNQQGMGCQQGSGQRREEKLAALGIPPEVSSQGPEAIQAYCAEMGIPTPREQMQQMQLSQSSIFGDGFATPTDTGSQSIAPPVPPTGLESPQGENPLFSLLQNFVGQFPQTN